MTSEQKLMRRLRRAGDLMAEMEKIGVAQIKLQTVYACKYTANKAKGTVVWTPVKGEGNALVSGSWKIKDNKKSTHLVLNVEAEVTLPLPALMELVATPVVEAELERLTEQYIAKLKVVADLLKTAATIEADQASAMIFEQRPVAAGLPAAPYRGCA